MESYCIYPISIILRGVITCDRVRRIEKVLRLDVSVERPV
jgi:hypothetical protein